MKKIKFSLLCIFILIVLNKQNGYAQDEKFKSIFIYNFTKLIEWPSDNQFPEFIITIYGNSGIISELQSVASKMKVVNKTIVIKQITSFSQLTATNVIYFCKEKTADLANFIAELQRQHILVITEKTNSCELGAAINFTNKSGSLGFEVSPNNINKSGLSVSKQLLSLGTVIGK
jgi:hypothetical protein